LVAGCCAVAVVTVGAFTLSTEFGQQEAAVAFTAANGPAECSASHALPGGSLLIVDLPRLPSRYRLRGNDFRHIKI
jgi:hypothetical protein